MSLLDNFDYSPSLFGDFTKAYNRLVELYNSNVSENGVLSTINELVTLKEEQKKEVDALKEEIDEICDDILFKLDHRERNGVNREIKKSNKKRIEGLKHKFSEHFGKQVFRHNIDDIDNLDDIEDSIWIEKQWIKELSELFGGESLFEIESLIKKAYKKAFILKKNAAQFAALESIISEIIQDGYNGYKEEITTLLPQSDKAKEKFKNSANKAGRKLDPTAPQKPIERKVQELANDKNFQKENGDPKPTSIATRIFKKHKDLTGELKQRQIFNRVKKALKNLGMQ